MIMAERYELDPKDAAVCHAIREAIKTAYPRVTITDLWQKVGLSSYAQLSNVVNARTKASPELIEALRKELKLSPNWLTRFNDGQIYSIAGIAQSRVPIVGKVSAGAGNYNVDPDEHYIYVPTSIAQLGGVGFLIDGDSMMPALQTGDVAVFREFRSPKRGLPFLIKTHSNEYRVKIINWDGKKWVLESLNPAYPVEDLADHELIGFLIAWYRARGTRETMDSDSCGLILTAE